jgi:hypothetical protein
MDISRWLCTSSSRRAWTCCRVMVEEFAEALIGAEADALCGRPTGSASPERGSPPWSSSLDDRRLLRCRCLHPALIVAVQETLTGAARQRGRIHFNVQPLESCPQEQAIRRRDDGSHELSPSPTSTRREQYSRIVAELEDRHPRRPHSSTRRAWRPSPSRASRRCTPPMLVEWTGGTFLY